MTDELGRLRAAGYTNWHNQAPVLYTKGLNDKQMAEALGVSVSSVRRWRVDSGLKPNGKTGRPRTKKGGW